MAPCNRPGVVTPITSCVHTPLGAQMKFRWVLTTIRPVLSPLAEFNPFRWQQGERRPSEEGAAPDSSTPTNAQNHSPCLGSSSRTGKAAWEREVHCLLPSRLCGQRLDLQALTSLSSTLDPPALLSEQILPGIHPRMPLSTQSETLRFLFLPFHSSPAFVGGQISW